MITDNWFIAAGLAIALIVGFWFMIKQQDKLIDKFKGQYDDDEGGMRI